MNKISKMMLNSKLKNMSDTLKILDNYDKMLNLSCDDDFTKDNFYTNIKHIKWCHQYIRGMTKSMQQMFNLAMGQGKQNGLIINDDDDAEDENETQQ